MLLFSCCNGYTPLFCWKCYFLMMCVTEQESFAGQESFEIRGEVCVPYPCGISCFRLFSVNSHLLFAFSYLIFIDLLCIFTPTCLGKKAMLLLLLLLCIFNFQPCSFHFVFLYVAVLSFPPNYRVKLLAIHICNCMLV